MFPLAEFEKPRRTWCQHAKGKGCDIHDQARPPVCTDFKCDWLRISRIPHRLRPDRIGCVVVAWPNDVAFVYQSFKGAADRADAKRMVDAYVAAGQQVVILWVADDGTTENRLRYDRTRYPTRPTCEELFEHSDEQQAKISRLSHFYKTGTSDCLWDAAQ